MAKKKTAEKTKAIKSATSEQERAEITVRKTVSSKKVSKKVKTEEAKLTPAKVKKKTTTATKAKTKRSTQKTAVDISPEKPVAKVKKISTKAKKVAVGGEKPVAVEEKPIQPEQPFNIEEIEIPPILFEDDSGQIVEGIGKKYALGPVPPPNHTIASSEPEELPESYGTGELVLIPRDPRWIFATWDLSSAKIRQYNELSATGTMTLRIYLNEISALPHREIQLHPQSRNWFVNVEQGGARYVAVLGYYDKNRVWNSVLTSSPVTTPPELKLKLPVEEAQKLQKIESPQAPAQPKIGVEIVKEEKPKIQFRTDEQLSGYEEETSLTPEQARQIAEFSYPYAQAGSAELIRRQEGGAEKPTSIEALFLPSSFELGISSLQAIPEKQERKFWFNIQAELVIYGATEPDACVVVGGKPVQLRADGTFSLRFALPDGEHFLSAKAISGDSKDIRVVELRFTRKTTSHGEVGEQAQSPELEPPKDKPTN